MTPRRNLAAGTVTALALLLASCSASGSGDGEAAVTTAGPTTTVSVPDPVTSTSTTEPQPAYSRADYVDALLAWQGAPPSAEEGEIAECMMDSWADSLELADSGADPDDIADSGSVDELLEVAGVDPSQREAMLTDLGGLFGSCGFGSFYIGQGFAEAGGSELSEPTAGCVDDAFATMSSEDPEVVVSIIEDSDPALVDTLMADVVARCPRMATELVISFFAEEGIEVSDAGADCLTGQFQVRLADVPDGEDVGDLFERVSEEAVTACREELIPR